MREKRSSQSLCRRIRKIRIMHFEPENYKTENFPNKGPIEVRSENRGLHLFERLKVTDLHIEGDLFIDSFNVTLTNDAADTLAHQLQQHIDATKIKYFSQAVDTALQLNSTYNNKIKHEVAERMEDMHEDGYFAKWVDNKLPEAIDKISTFTMDILIDRMFDRILERDSTMIQRLETKIRQHKLQRFQLAVEENEENGDMRPE